VIRGYQGDPFWSPSEGFMYSGLYEVVACWTEQGTSFGKSANGKENRDSM
jgi:hypothetical protein